MMMKTKKNNYAFLLLLIAVGFMTSCVHDDDYDTPDTSIDPVEIDSINVIPIGVLIGGAPAQGFQTFKDSIHYTSGYVVSSDEAGNFYQEMVIQDKPENPTAGLKILLSVSPLFTNYEIGRKIYVKLDGFTFGTNDGIPTMGIPNGKFLAKAPASFESKIIRSTELASIVPLPVSLADAKNHQGVLVKIDSVEFITADKDKTFASDAGDGFDGERKLEDCGDSSVDDFIFSTSNFADFKSLRLPKGSGSITGIILRNYQDDYDIISINDPSFINFDQERCDGDGGGGSSDETEVLSEDFSGLTEFDPVSLPDWTNQNVNGGSTFWQARNFNNDGYAQTSAFGSDESPLEVWLVTPSIDLSNSTSGTLTFETQDAYNDGDVLSVSVSTDFSGDASQATWTELTDAQFATGNSGGYGEAGGFTSSGNVDLSDFAGENIYIGIRYLGSSANGPTTNVQLDNIKVTAN